jgi:hypothetical protein
VAIKVSVAKLDSWKPYIELVSLFYKLVWVWEARFRSASGPVRKKGLQEGTFGILTCNFGILILKFIMLALELCPQLRNCCSNLIY